MNSRGFSPCHPKYILSYDAIQDVIKVISIDQNNIFEIIVYYDDQGDETVDFWRIIPIEDDIYHVIYTPNKYYYFSKMQYGMFSESYAKKIDGNWNMLSENVDTTAAYYTKTGEYNFNGSMYSLYANIQKNNTNYGLEISDNIYRKDTNELVDRYNPEALETDYHKFYLHNILSFFFKRFNAMLTILPFYPYNS